MNNMRPIRAAIEGRRFSHKRWLGGGVGLALCLGPISALAFRGDICDRQGQTLATTVPVVAIYADLTLCGNRAAAVAQTLAPLLQMSAADVASRLGASAGTAPGTPAKAKAKAVALKRNVSLADWATLTNALAQSNFGLDPQKLTPEDRTLLGNLRRRLVFPRAGVMRVFPWHERLAHVVGHVTAEADAASLKGASGIEFSFDAALSGSNAPATAAANRVVLTVDMRLQEIVEHALTEAVTRHSPLSASVLVVRPRTGEILAWACHPTFDPQQIGKTSPQTWRNRPVSDWVEPGSTFSIVTMAAALNEGLVKLDDRLDCEQGSFTFAGKVLHDSSPFGVLTVQEVLAKSSSIGAAKTSLRLGPERFYASITNFGFGQRTGITLPAETAGRIAPVSRWSRLSPTRIAIGQEVAVSQLQMTMALSAIANGGRLMRPLIVSRIETPQGQAVTNFSPESVRTVLRPEIAAQVIAALKSVVAPGGTGMKAALESYAVAGKTGTAQKAGPAGYLPGHYYASFLGVVPAEAPELCISVALDEPDPKTGYYGGQVAAPLFREIARQALPLLGIPPSPPAKGAADK